ncbi:MAG: hypothetical protein ACI9S8_000397, partial [Chlamydiales bacterium]
CLQVEPAVFCSCLRAGFSRLLDIALTIYGLFFC